MSLTAAVYRSFRAPTLNELYRSFRQGNVQTNANAALTAEHLTGGEAGVQFEFSSLRVKSVFFEAHLADPVGNITLSTTPATIVRERMNIGETRSRGIEVEAEWQRRNWTLSPGYQWTQSNVIANAATPTLVGLLIPEVPRHQFTMQARYSSSAWTFAIQARGSGMQFDDDLNTLVLPGYFTLDAYASRRLGAHLQIFAAAEGLTGERYMVARTPVPTYGPPALARAGIRVFAGGGR